MKFGRAVVDENGLSMLVELVDEEGRLVGHLIQALSIPKPPPPPERHFGFGVWSRLKSIATTGKKP